MPKKSLNGQLSEWGSGTLLANVNVPLIKTADLSTQAVKSGKRNRNTTLKVEPEAVVTVHLNITVIV